MEVRLRAAAAPRTRPARDARATSRSRARARGTRSRTHHRPPIAHRAAQHCPLHSAPRTATHTLHTAAPTTCLRVETPGLGRRDSKGHKRMCSCETESPASSGHSWSMRLNMSHMCPLWPLLCTESTQSTKSRSICSCSAPPRTTTTPAPATARAQSRGWAAQTSNSAPRHGSESTLQISSLKPLVELDSE